VIRESTCSSFICGSIIVVLGGLGGSDVLAVIVLLSACLAVQLLVFLRVLPSFVVQLLI
jgi:hypothetical protein